VISKLPANFSQASLESEQRLSDSLGSLLLSKISSAFHQGITGGGTGGGWRE
jgi:hypothetical protein